LVRYACAHCGLPVSASTGLRLGKAGLRPGEADTAGPLYCCYGCALVSRIVGRGQDDGARAWAVLRLAVGALLAMNVMMVSLLLYTGSVEEVAVPAFRWVMLGLATPAVILLGYPMVAGAVKDLARRRVSLDALIALGSLAAYGASAAATVRGSGQVFFDTATMLLALVTFGKLVEATAKARAGQLLRGLETLLPARAMRLQDDGPHEVSIEELRVGDRIQVRPGERFAVDGAIVEGTTVVEEAAFTGESRPAERGPGDLCLAGTVNGPAAVIVEARAVGEDLLVRRIAEMAEKARAHPSDSERLAERAASLFVPAVLVLALVAGFAWFWIDGPRAALFSSLAVLVVACPCAMGIAAPLATAMAIARAARAGVLVRGGDVMERAGQVRTIFFDKTGTLTAGRPSVRRIEVFDGNGGPRSVVAGSDGARPSTTTCEEELLSRLASLESASEHALGRAVCREAVRRRVATGATSGLEIVPGQGLRGTVTLDGWSGEVVAGTGDFVAGITDCGLRNADCGLTAGKPSGIAAEFGHEIRSPQSSIRNLPVSDSELTVIDVAWNDRLRGRVLLSDEVRPDAAEAVRRLKEMGVESVLLSGDRSEAARQVAVAVGIARVEAPRRPDQKLAVIQSAAHSLQSATCLVGDGINDAPALAAADVGIALGAGTDMARQAGGVVLVSDRLTQVPWLMSLGRRTRRIIRQNLWWALGYNAVALAAAATGVLHPLLAAVAMVVSSLTVLGNSLRLQRFSDDLPQERQ
jgi:heavy metal translocating P-type ATPase